MHLHLLPPSRLLLFVTTAFRAERNRAQGFLREEKRKTDFLRLLGVESGFIFLLTKWEQLVTKVTSNMEKTEWV